MPSDPGTKWWHVVMVTATANSPHALMGIGLGTPSPRNNVGVQTCSCGFWKNNSDPGAIASPTLFWGEGGRAKQHVKLSLLPG